MFTAKQYQLFVNQGIVDGRKVDGFIEADADFLYQPDQLGDVVVGWKYRLIQFQGKLAIEFLWREGEE